MSWLFEQLPMYQRQGAAAYKTDLDGTWAVLESMGRPDLKLPNVIHVAGTNGKGSVCQAVHNALVDQGFKVGLFTSPHLHDFRERMRVNGAMPSEDWVVDFVTVQRKEFERLDLKPSFFEWTFGMAMCYFSCMPGGFGGIGDGHGRAPGQHEHLPSTSGDGNYQYWIGSYPVSWK